ncbi:MAG: YicC family protein [Clostridiales bacterium]|nr:YicC family protein [Clostridiales bacterium]
MYSMTGYGRGEYKKGGVELTVEIKTVNNRYLDAVIKAPRIFAAHEENIRGIIREKLTRGHADVFISFSDKREREKVLNLDENAARSYVAAADKISALFPEITNDLTVTSVLRYPEVLKSEDAAAADDEIIAAMVEALKSSLEKLNAMRKIEGEKLKCDMLSRMNTIEKLVSEVEVRAPLVVEGYRAKLEAKMKKILDNTEVDESRLLTEAALFADKSNIDEELTRLHSHISQFREICEEELVGRKLDFLVQEFNRETNTICSKSNDIEITRLGLALKNEIEKVREQVQNVE